MGVCWLLAVGAVLLALNCSLLTLLKKIWTHMKVGSASCPLPQPLPILRAPDANYKALVQLSDNLKLCLTSIQEILYGFLLSNVQRRRTRDGLLKIRVDYHTDRAITRGRDHHQRNMALRLEATSCSLIRLGLLIIMVAQQSAARKLTDGYEKDIEQFVNMKINDQTNTHIKEVDDGHQKMSKNHMHVHAPSHMEHLDPLLYVFFILSDLKVGKKMPLYFPYSRPSETPKLLPREEAESIPFSTSQLEYLLTLFSFPRDSPQAKAVEYTLKQCELESINGETKFCATSLESMLDFAIKMLGSETQLKVLTSSRLSNSTILLQNYTILEEPRETVAVKMVACHSMPYPYAIFYCHCQESNNRLFEILLGADNGDRVKASAICHMDTSQWDKDHASFKVLKTKPGASHVCHFVSTDSLVWLAA